MAKCPDCGKTFKSPQAVATHRSWVHGNRRRAARRSVKAAQTPVARQRVNPTSSSVRRSQVTVRIGDRDLTPQEFSKLVDEMLVVRNALTRVR